MVYKEAARKTGAFVALAALGGLAMTTFIGGEGLSPTGLAIGTTTSTLSGASWIVFALGFFVGALILGTYVYVAHIDHDDRL